MIQKQFNRMKQLIIKRSLLVLVGVFMFSLTSLFAQDKSKVYEAEPIVKDKLEVIKERLNLTADQLTKVKAIDKQCEEKLEAAVDNTAARKVYQWRDGEYKKVFTAEQYKAYMKEKQDIVDEAQFRWMREHGTVVAI